jgi:integrase/recombinase XerD
MVINSVGLLRFERKSMAPEAMVPPVEKKYLDEFIKLRQIEGLSDTWLYQIRMFITDYLDFVKWIIDKEKTLDYFAILQKKQSTTSYRKRVYQIRKFLSHLNVQWAGQINPPPEPLYLPKRITSDAIQDTLSCYQNNEYYLQVKAIILLGTTSGMRAEELYQLTLDDINLDTRTVMINHNPNNGQSTKTKRSRISFFTDDAKHALSEYVEFYHSHNGLKCLFSQTHIERLFRNGKASIQVKDLRKYFSQIWDRNGGATSIKKILMGHSLKGDVDLQHYNYQSEDDLKMIYDRVMSGSIIYKISNPEVISP